MGTIIRRNERSWAIVIISEIKVMLNGLGLKIKSAGGESTLSVNKKSMFPDVLLYEDEAQTKILQGWELKMPDVLITDEALIADATMNCSPSSRQLKKYKFFLPVEIICWQFYAACK